MSDNSYTPEQVWSWKKANGGKFANINRPVSGATYDAQLPQGQHPFQLYSLATPNGVKVTIMFEELLAKGITQAEYDAYLIDISEGEQFSTGFVDVNPNSKIPALVDNSGEKPVKLFESGAILLHLAEKFNAFIPQDPAKRAECLTWLFWQVGSGPFLGGGFGHFYHYAPEKFEYPIERFTMEVKRQLDVLDKHLADNAYMCGDEYTIADMAIWPWYGVLARGGLYEAAQFLDVQSYQNLQRWAAQIAEREAVKRGKMVNRAWGEPQEQLLERHHSSDFALKTQDKLASD